MKFKFLMKMAHKNKVVKKYGLKAFMPIAKNFPYNDYDDFEFQEAMVIREGT